MGFKKGRIKRLMVYSSFTKYGEHLYGEAKYGGELQATKEIKGKITDIKPK